jgi:hypothetical protein
VTNRKVYIHEFIDIIGHNRATYMQHMTANWSPIGQEERNQLCYGVWGVVGTTGAWPQVVNLWEEDGLDGLARSFRHELSHATLQDPKLAKWWSDAAGLRRSGFDRVLLPAPWTRTIEELCAQGIHGEAYAHEQIRVPRGTASRFLDAVAERATEPYGEHGWELIGAWETAMIDESECFLLWALPTWESWASLEHAERRDSPVRGWRTWVYHHSESWQRFLMVDAPLSPLRTGRQPRRSDRVDWDESPPG